MYEEKIKMAAIFYLIGMVVYLAWILFRNQGIKGFRETIDELSEDYLFDRWIIVAIVIGLEVLLVGAWPFSMHIGIKEKLGKAKES